MTEYDCIWGNLYHLSSIYCIVLCLFYCFVFFIKFENFIQSATLYITHHMYVDLHYALYTIFSYWVIYSILTNSVRATQLWIWLSKVTVNKTKFLSSNLLISSCLYREAEAHPTLLLMHPLYSRLCYTTHHYPWLRVHQQD